jgi:hypothetical protein
MSGHFYAKSGGTADITLRPVARGFFIAFERRVF